MSSALSVVIFLITLVYKIFLKNALYLVFNWFPLILGRWFRIRSPFLAVWSEFCSVASFVFFGLENQIFEIFENLANFFLKISNIFLKTIKLWTICKKNFWNRPIGSGDIACQSSKKRQNLKNFDFFRKSFCRRIFLSGNLKKNYWILHIFPRRSRRKLPLLSLAAF